MRIAGHAGWRFVCAICALGADARADKKKAGLFDIDWWKPPVKREHDAAQQLAPRA